MPADTNKPTRKALKTSTEEEIERWRSRGEISCAECKRLKLKCDKGLPCGACVRRGCSAICPNGSLSTGHGTRFVLADTEELHEQIARMSQRIRLLEDGLAISHSLSSATDPHPLLKDELKKIKFGADAMVDTQAKPKLSPTTAAAFVNNIEALGTLTIGDNGATKYFGRAAGTEAILMIGSESDEEYEAVDDEYPLSIEVTHQIGDTFTASVFGVRSLSSEQQYASMMELLYDKLPSRQRALQLNEYFTTNLSWIFNPMQPDEAIELINHIYDAHEERATFPQSTTWLDISPHKLSLFFFLLAIGALMDLGLAAFNEEAKMYHQIGKAAMALRSVFDSPSIDTVQAIAMLGFYTLHDGRRHSFEAAWSLMALANKLAQSCGLHRDCGKLGFHPVLVQRRRSLFWELHSLDVYFSVALGRPVTMSLMNSDCEYPADKTPGQISTEIYKAIVNCFTSVFDCTLSPTMPPYEKVLELDRLVRDKIPPPPENPLETPLVLSGPLPFAIMKYVSLVANRSSALIYLHRSFFAQAIMDNPENPAKSKYGPSFLAAYREASWTIKMCVFRVSMTPELCKRWWSLWTHVFTAALIVGTIVSRAPAAEMASTALVELGLAIDTFEKAAADSRSRGSLAILAKLRDSATETYSAFVRDGTLPQRKLLSQSRDELELLAGQTRVATSRRLNESSSRRMTVSPERSLSPRDLSESVKIGSPRQSNASALSPVSQSGSSVVSPKSAAGQTSYHDFFNNPLMNGVATTKEPTMPGSFFTHGNSDYPWGQPGNGGGGTRTNQPTYLPPAVQWQPAMASRQDPPSQTASSTHPTNHVPNQQFVPSQNDTQQRAYTFPMSDNHQDMNMFEAAGTSDQQWDHNWMEFLKDSGLS